MFPFFNFLYKKKEKSNRLNETAKMNFFVVLVGIVSNIITQSKEIIIQRVTSQREGHVLHTRQQCVYRETSSKTSSIFLIQNKSPKMQISISISLALSTISIEKIGRTSAIFICKREQNKRKSPKKAFDS
jgi:hypothetical protein